MAIEIDLKDILLVLLTLSIVVCVIGWITAYDSYEDITYENAFERTPYFYEINICYDVCDFMAHNHSELWDCNANYCKDKYLTKKIVSP